MKKIAVLPATTLQPSKPPSCGTFGPADNDSDPDGAVSSDSDCLAKGVLLVSLCSSPCCVAMVLEKTVCSGMEVEGGDLEVVSATPAASM